MSEIAIDVKYLLQIAEQDKDLVSDIVDDFEKDTQKAIDKIVEHSEPQIIDLSLLQGVLHKLKGGAGSLGMVSLYNFIVEMESWNSEEWLRNFKHTALREHVSLSVALCKKSLM